MNTTTKTLFAALFGLFTLSSMVIAEEHQQQQNCQQQQWSDVMVSTGEIVKQDEIYRVREIKQTTDLAPGESAYISTAGRPYSGCHSNQLRLICLNDRDPQAVETNLSYDPYKNLGYDGFDVRNHADFRLMKADTSVFVDGKFFHCFSSGKTYKMKK